MEFQQAFLADRLADDILHADRNTRSRYRVPAAGLTPRGERHGAPIQ
jgi:hypothetical protein